MMAVTVAGVDGWHRNISPAPELQGRVSRVGPLGRPANIGVRLPLPQLSSLYLGCGAPLARTTVSNP